MEPKSGNDKNSKISEDGRKNFYSWANYKPDFQERPSYLNQVVKNSSATGIFLGIEYIVCLLVTVSSFTDYWNDRDRFNTFWSICLQSVQGTYPHGLTAFTFLFFWACVKWSLVKFMGTTARYLILELAWMSTLFIGSTYFATKESVGVTLRIVIGCETVRCGMKGWSLAAETRKLTRDGRATLGEFIYFLFAPTLIFRKNYPQTRFIRWKKVALYFAISFIQVISGFKILAGVVWPQMLLVAKDTSHLYEPRTFILMLASSGLVIPMMWFFHFHLWQNLWAELLRFSDRQFYGPWWNSHHSSSLLKDWNPLIHIFIKEYLAKPLSKTGIGFKERFLLISIVSGLAHDFIFSFIVKRSCFICTTTYFGGLLVNFMSGKEVTKPILQMMTVLIPGLYVHYLSYQQALEEIHDDKNLAHQQTFHFQDVYISNLN
ncbi:sterol O-acyltransferase 2-like [Brevipalpus obovatus]|uniref:sterol O-acyltransferase 2-like n=1 Tax=Brevipalpus obovatus TaxID=246614 RepID=UPI003D9ED983